MIDLGHLKGKTVAVLGLGKSGLSSARALSAAGATVLAWDDSRPDAAASVDGVIATDLRQADLGRADMLVLSPGIPRCHPAPHVVVARAHEAGCPIVSDIDLLGRARPDAHYLGVTGTNGKSTTTALIGHILTKTGPPTQIGGNLGIPALSLKPLGDEGWYVLELSSYQLETVSAVAWDVAILINVAPDHLDRYADMDGYVDTKRRIFARQPPGGTAIVGIDDRWSRATRDELAGRTDLRLVPISADTEAAGGVFVRDGVLIDATDDAGRAVLDLRTVPTLPGRHNWQNAAAAYAAALSVGIAPDDIATAMRSFPGLRHRQELVGSVGALSFVNDSKATNPDAAARALACYDRIYWIAGGLPKQGGLEVLEPHFRRIAHAFLVGQAAEMLAGFLDGKVAVTQCGEIGRAVEAAVRQAEADGGGEAVVLLSPACASWDQFANFEARGDAFVAAVRALARRSAAPDQALPAAGAGR